MGRVHHQHRRCPLQPPLHAGERPVIPLASRRGSGGSGSWVQGVVKLRQEGAALVCVSSSDTLDSHAVYNYLGLEEDLESILASIMKDAKITEAVQKFYGLRLLKQDVWECLLSFAIATNSNIPRIRRMISNLCDPRRTHRVRGRVATRSSPLPRGSRRPSSRTSPRAVSATGRDS